MHTPENDIRTRFIFDNMPVRGAHVRLDSVWQHIVGRKHYPAAIRRALGELLAAGALLSGNLKEAGTLILQVQGQGVLKMLVVEATYGRTCRATARWDEDAAISDDAGLAELLGKRGVFVITLQPENGETWQGMVPLEGGSIAAMLDSYMLRSEQLNSRFVLAADDNNAAGLLLQRLPGHDSGQDNADWQHLDTLAQTATAKELLELDGQNLLYRLFHETPPRVFPEENMEFACSCSRAKVSDMLLLLGAKEVGDVVAEEGSITVGCDFCNEKYTFDEEEVQNLFGDAALSRATIQ